MSIFKFKVVNMQNILSIHEGDLLEVKKAHPCGSKTFKVIRTGSDVKIMCTECSRTLTLERIKLEKMVKKVISTEVKND